eukprot:CAMPEP_0175273742 /NCGR_PEP_ID=MMETSP0093-20121207/47105_1 /TAXON_ID=311494 /ORGANISM="Alexandrium monilatum, Strain CCMP3105" /LENGTH=54 /DNA_ID=CAMNT_0016568587 /DNA_START=11 /DNA_END=172 /DNA_ORIENTATION=+
MSFPASPSPFECSRSGDALSSFPAAVSVSSFEGLAALASSFVGLAASMSSLSGM